MSAFYGTQAGKGRQSVTQPGVAKSTEADLSGLLFYALYAALWDSGQPESRDRSLKRSGVSLDFPPRWNAEREKLR